MDLLTDEEVWHREPATWPMVDMAGSKSGYGGLVNDVHAVNQYAVVMQAPTAYGHRMRNAQGADTPQGTRAVSTTVAITRPVPVPDPASIVHVFEADGNTDQLGRDAYGGTAGLGNRGMGQGMYLVIECTTISTRYYSGRWKNEFCRQEG